MNRRKRVDLIRRVGLGGTIVRACALARRIEASTTKIDGAADVARAVYTALALSTQTRAVNTLTRGAHGEYLVKMPGARFCRITRRWRPGPLLAPLARATHRCGRASATLDRPGDALGTSHRS